MSFTNPYSDFDGSKDEWEELWNFARGKRSRWETYITEKNWDIAHRTFMANRKNVKILSADDFDRKHADLERDSHYAGVVNGVTEKGEFRRTRDSFYIKNGYIDLRATTERFGAAKTYMFNALHELVHWLSAPVDQSDASVVRHVLSNGLTEGLVAVVVEDLLNANGFSMGKSGPQAYADLMAVVQKMIGSLGVAPFGKALFQGQTNELVVAAEKKWDLSNAGFLAYMPALWHFANNNQTRQAMSCVDALIKRNQRNVISNLSTGLKCYMPAQPKKM